MAYLVRAATPLDVRPIKEVYFRSWCGAYGPFLELDMLEHLALQRSRDFDWSRGIRSDHATVLIAVDEVGSVLGVVQANEASTRPVTCPRSPCSTSTPRHGVQASPPRC